jgi:SAM-dependent methyltransferase
MMSVAAYRSLLSSYVPRVFKDWVGHRRKFRRFHKEFLSFSQLQARSGRKFEVSWDDRWPCLDDATQTTPFDKHYLFHLAWAARVLARTRPAKHVDVSSALQFASMVSAFVPTEYYEFRPVSLGLDGLTTRAADITHLPIEGRSVSSLSCMHVVEHIGLGRYGDALAPDADLAAMDELSRVLAPGGNLLFVVPVGAPRIQFNAHRIYSYNHIVTGFGALRLVEFALIPDHDDPQGIVVNAPSELVEKQRYGCGCFWFQAPSQ